MLLTEFAAEKQFRHDSEARARELAIGGAIRDRREALAAPVTARAAPRRVATWPRPVGVKRELASCATTACVV